MKLHGSSVHVETLIARFQINYMNRRAQDTPIGIAGVTTNTRRFKFACTEIEGSRAPGQSVQGSAINSTNLVTNFQSGDP